MGSTKTALVDTSSPLVGDDVEEQLLRVLGDRRLDFIVPTHPELQHMGNMPRILDLYPDAMVVGDLRDYHLFFPGQCDRFVYNMAEDVIDLGDRRLVFVDAALKDLPNTLWVYDTGSRTLFVSDGFAYIHHYPTDCALLASELSALPSHGDVEAASSIIYHWVQHVDADFYFEEVAALLAVYPACLLAPAHANVVDTVDSVIAVVRESMLAAREAR
jgi:hypothetical protein